jgi:hypothetical protein
MPQGGGVGGADQRAREADQDRREDREPQLLSHIPDGSGYRGRCSPKSCRRLPASRRSSASSSLASDPALFMPTQVTPGAGQDTASLRRGRVNGLVRSPSVGLTCDNLLPRIPLGAILAPQPEPGKMSAEAPDRRGGEIRAARSALPQPAMRLLVDRRRQRADDRRGRGQAPPRRRHRARSLGLAAMLRRSTGYAGDPGALPISRSAGFSQYPASRQQPATNTPQL